MALQLFPHNQAAYDAALAMMKENGRAAVVHPTGTGKSFIAFQLALEHPDETVLWVAPSEYIFQTQLKRLSEAMPGFLPEMLRHVTFLTYARLFRDGAKEIRPDWIILDEFHRAGSPQWGRGVWELMGESPAAKVLGLSATSVRYLDGQRDMADELFCGHIASEMTLGEAIARGILPAPKYVTSLYSYQKEWARIKGRVQKARRGIFPKEDERLLEELKRALEDADGLDAVFERHMENPHGRYLVFCSGKEHMEGMMGKAAEWFAKVDRNLHLYSVAYDDPGAAREYMRFQEDRSDHLRLLFSIDMLNEGIHVEGVDGVILLRPTVSPILYLQQIGRALAAGSGLHPVIFDIVDNFDALRSIDSVRLDAEAYFSRMPGADGGRDLLREAFQIIDEARDCREIFRRIQGRLFLGWEAHYLEAQKFFQEHGHLRVPKSYITPSGLSLGAWLMTQRRVYLGKAPGKLDQSQASRLSAIGMEWEAGSERGLERGLKELRKYVKAHGDADVAAGYVTEEGYQLGKWVSNVRQRRKGASGKELTEGQIARLNEAGMIWDRADFQWRKNYRRAEAFFQGHGHLNVPRGYVTEDGMSLGIWVENQRKAYGGRKRGAAALTEGQIQLLNAIGMEWSMESDRLWDDWYGRAKDYFRSYGDLRVPSSYCSLDGRRLGRWVGRQKEKYREGALSKEHLRLLCKIGFEKEFQLQETEMHQDS